MINNPVKKLTTYYILIITILCILVSSVIYLNVEKRSEDALKQIESKLELKFDTNDPRYLKRVQYAEESVKNFQKRSILNLTLLNLAIITIIGTIAYFFAKKTLKPVEESIRKQKDFISNVTHELKTPLTALKSTFEVSLRSKESNLSDTIKSGIEEVDKMNQLIDEFLKLSSLDSKNTEIKKVEINLDSLIDEITHKNIFKIKTKELEIIKNLNFKIIQTDKFLFTELISIIFDNAIKFNKQKGTIEIKTYKQNGQDVISISDTGLGINQDIKDKIFERFYKEDSSRIQAEGYGVGLSLADEISKLLNCEIEVESEKEKGTKFNLKFSAIFKN